MVGSIFQVVPVLDVLRGEAVHAVGGERARYQPLRSILHPTSDPLELARAYRDTLGLSSLYLADLDAITAGAPNAPLYRSLTGLGLDLWIDSGVRDERDLAPLLDLDLDRVSVVAGLESLRGPEALAAVLDRIGPDRLVVSLDLWAGRPITASQEAWGDADAETLAARFIALGVRRLLLLDLTRVGKGNGPGVDDLLGAIRAAAPEVDVALGGGITSIEGVERYRGQGAAAVLIGSAFHDGRIGRDQLAALLWK
ncbi:MAG: HisA/HisF-related TIM barrel protein [Paludisphaera borealis]|uniref:HisA/HisF-related TIM barrel protein n=1 Tax=Paludisphaera borealis TaxID=1387353 RepID=UPI00283F0247|nr:HisA/HisF-related TIM barrel protein [Paludisphaera borealis]MDR3621013.1 HisA/HisF-related TIM barrel protein [Paludisphaera borealis]